MRLQKYNGYPFDTQIQEGLGLDLFFQACKDLGLDLSLGLTKFNGFDFESKRSNSDDFESKRSDSNPTH